MLHVRKKRQYTILVKYATTTCCICIKIMKLYANTWFGVVSWLITSSGASTVRHDMNMDHVYSHHDDGGDKDDVGENDEGFDVDEPMQNVACGVLLQCRNKGFNNFETLNKALRDLLYEECKGCHKDHMVLWMTLELLKLKPSNGCSDSSFSALLELLSKVLPKPNGLPTSTYLAKKIIYLLTLDVEKIHAFPNHSILYRKEHEFKDKCPRCNSTWYKWNNNIEEDSYNNKRKG
jgi:hypothetical protein